QHEGFSEDLVSMERSLGMRYVGQSWELVVSIPGKMNHLRELEELFWKAHEHRYGHGGAGACQIVSLRVAATGKVNRPDLEKTRSNRDNTHALPTMRKVVFEGKAWQTPVYQRDSFPADEAVE